MLNGSEAAWRRTNALDVEANRARLATRRPSGSRPSKVVEAFERVEAAFGRDWIEQSRTLPSVVPKGAAPQVTIDRGAYPVLTVVKMGALLASLPRGNTWRGRAHRQASPRRACSHRRGHAIHLLRQHPSDSEVELEPRSLSLDGLTREALAFAGDPWTYVEVGATDKAATERGSCSRSSNSQHLSTP